MEHKEYFTREEFINMVEAYNKAEKERQQLKAENEKLRVLCDTYKTCYQAKHSDIKCLFPKYKQTLQKIKRYIAKICKEECGYVQKKRCPDCDCRYGAILDLITKAEEE